MATRTNYFALLVNEGYLKAYPMLAARAEHGVVQGDLTRAQSITLAKINQWIVQVAGVVRGPAIVAEFMDDANPLDPIIPVIAEKVAASYVLEWMEKKNFSNAPAENQPGRQDSTTLRQEAIAIMDAIQRSGKTLKADNLTVRRWRMGSLESGPVVGGPMSSGSFFALDGVFTDPYGRQWQGPRPLADLFLCPAY